MSRPIQRMVWGAVAAVGLVLSPLPAVAADSPDPARWSTPFTEVAEAGGTLELQEGYIDVVGVCAAFTATNHYPASVEFYYGDFDNVYEDGVVVLAQGQTVRIATRRALIDYGAFIKGTESLVGVGEDVPVDQGCNERYVTNVYQDLFNRAPDPQGLASWTAALNAGSPRIQVANSITYSNEFRSQLITGVYDAFLGRAPDAKGLADWLAAMQSGVTISQMESGFIASDEYYAAAGSPAAGWVQALYGDVLGRGASQAEVDGWIAVLNKGASRQSVSMGFLLSTERLNTIVEGYYQHLLGRGVDAAGQASWVQILQAGGRDEAIIGGIIASDEYYDAS